MEKNIKYEFENDFSEWLKRFVEFRGSDSKGWFIRLVGVSKKMRKDKWMEYRSMKKIEFEEIFNQEKNKL